MAHPIRIVNSYKSLFAEQTNRNTRVMSGVKYKNSPVKGLHLLLLLKVGDKYTTVTGNRAEIKKQEPNINFYPRIDKLFLNLFTNFLPNKRVYSGNRYKIISFQHDKGPNILRKLVTENRIQAIKLK